MSEVATRVCRECRTERILNSTAWYPNKLSKDGYRQPCLLCCRVIDAARYQSRRVSLLEALCRYCGGVADVPGEKLCKFCRSAKNADWHRKNPKYYLTIDPQKNRAQSERWRRKNPELAALASKRWAERNPGANRSNAAKRRSYQKKATPEWAERTAIRRFYEKCPPGYEVDHIVPLRGKTVCGLHVRCNLQYLPIAENRAKGNRWEDDQASRPPAG